MTEPLFRSAHDALIFAFNYSGQQYGRMPMNAIAAPASSGKGLSGVDGAAQAGMIRRNIASLGKIHEAILVSRFAPKTVQVDLCSCPNCNGNHPNREWSEAMETLAQHLKENVLEGCATTWDMRIQYINRIFLPKSANISQDMLAKRNNVTRKTVASHCSLVKKFFSGKEGMEAFSLSVIEEQLIEIGMVEKS